MKASDDLLESLSLEISDGGEPDWDSAAAALPESDRKLLPHLRSLSHVAGFFRQCHGALPRRAAGDRWGDLEILGHVGSGSCADVYLARDQQLNREVALKLIRTGAGTELLEAERLARVKHPHLVAIHGAAVRDGTPGLWMEYVRGITLHELVRTQGPLSARETTLLGIELCGAIAALHAAGLLHRDIKAHNVMREQGGRIVLMDLGSGAEIECARHECPGAVSGTPLYMAPEVLGGAAGDARSDIYSLGVLLYFAATGAYPVTAGTLVDLRERHASGERRRLRGARPDLPGSFVAVIERALSPEPGQRFAGAGEMELALNAALGLTPDVRRGGQRGHAWRWATGILLTGTLTLMTGLVWPGWLLGPYTVHASLYRQGPGGDQELLPGGRVAPGDRLYLSFQASRDMHVYVLAEDERGEAYVLFPLPGPDPANPLPGDRPHRLPPHRDGRAYTWGVSSAGGTEHVLIVASPEALGTFEQALATLPAPRMAVPDAAVLLDAEALAALRGIGLLLEQPPARDPIRPRPVFALARQLAGGPERSRGVWVRQIDLVNPGP